MGATNFSQVAHGPTARDAFAKARDEALYYHGHGGYSGTIAEKGSFLMGWDRKHPQLAKLTQLVDLSNKRAHDLESALGAVIDLEWHYSKPVRLADFAKAYDAGDKKYTAPEVVWEQLGYKTLRQLLAVFTDSHVKFMAETYWEKWGPALCVPLEGDAWLFIGHASC